MSKKSNGGEGNRRADRRYREGVRETVRNTPESEREKKARDLTPDELEDAKSAEEKGRSRARK